MAAFCVNIPEVNGEASKLFMELQELLKIDGNPIVSRQKVIFAYELLTDAEFIQKNIDKVILNDQNQIANPEAFLNINEESEIKIIKDSLESNFKDDNESVIKDVVDFNKENKDYIATLNTINGKESKVDITKINKDNRDVKKAEKDTLETSSKAFSKINEFMKSLGLTVAVTDASILNFESGMMNPQMIGDLSTDILGVINIANNTSGLIAISEEFGHFFIENIKDSPLIRRLEHIIRSNPDIAKAILGNDYDTVVEYYTARGKKDQIERECIGRLFAELLNESDYINSEVKSESIYKKSMNFALARLKMFFGGNIKAKSGIDLVESIKKELLPLINVAFNKRMFTKENLRKLKESGEVFYHNNDTLNKLYKGVSSLINAASIYKEEHKYSGSLLAQQALNSQDNYTRDVYNAISSNIPNFDGTIDVEKLATMSDSGLAETLASLINFAKHINNVLMSHQQAMNMMRFDTSTPMHKLQFYASNLRDINNYSQYFILPMQELSRMASSVLKNSTNTTLRDLASEFITVCNSIINCNNNLNDDFRTNLRELLSSYFLPFFNEGKDSIKYTEPGIERIITFADVLDFSMGDIGGISRLIESAASIPDLWTKLYNIVIRKKQEQIRQRVEEINKAIVANSERYRAEGGKDESFILVRDDSGVPTGWLLNPENRDYGAYMKALNDYKKSLIDSGLEEDSLEYQQKIEEWKEENRDSQRKEVICRTVEFDRNGNKKIVSSKRKFWMPSAKYKTKIDYNTLSDRDKRFLDEYLRLKNELDSLLPYNVPHPYKAIQREIADVTEGIFTGDGVGDSLKKGMFAMRNKLMINDNDNGELFDEAQHNRVKEWFMRKFKHKSDKKPFLKVDINGNIVKEIPVYYVNLLKNMKAMSLDVTQSLSEYALMAINYNGVHEIADILELANIWTKDFRDYKYTDENDEEYQKRVNWGGRIFGIDASKKGADTNIYKKVRAMTDSFLYSRNKLKIGNIMGADASKLADGLMSLVAFSQLGWNFFSSFNNRVVARYQMMIEACGGEFFTFKEWLKGEKEYMKMLPEYVRNLSKAVKTDKLSLIEETFNVGLKWRNNLKDKEYYRKNGMRAAMHFLNPSFGLEAGEHRVHCATAITMLMKYRMRDANGNETNLLDALEVEDIMDNGINVGARLRLKDGCKKITIDDNGNEVLSEFTGLSKADKGKTVSFEDLKKTNLYDDVDPNNDVVKLSLLIGKINQDLHGIYNQEDYPEAKKTVLGRLIFMYRNFFIPTWMRRWRGTFTKDKSKLYDFYSGRFETGSSADMIMLFKNLFLTDVDELKAMSIKQRMKILWSQLSHHQQTNIKRAQAEIVSLITLTLLIALLFSSFGLLAPDDDDKDEEGIDRWLARQSEYFLRRLKLESTMPYNPLNIYTIFVSPMAVTGYATKTFDMMKHMFDFEELQTGPYKGHSKAYSYFMRWMPIVPQVRDFFTIDTDDRRFKIFE